MPVENYGVWKAHPVHYTIERHEDDPKSPHLSLYFHDLESGQPKYDTSFTRREKDIKGLYRAAINIKSGDPLDSRLAYWVNHGIDQNPLVDGLATSDFGFRALTDKRKSNERGLDYIRDSLFNTHSGRLLPHDVAGQYNDIIDVLEPHIRQAIEENADVYLFGSQFSDGKGMHNIHMNQGNIRKYRDDDGVFHDGGLIIHFTHSGKWLGVFLGFASQAVHTDDRTGHAITGVTWSDFLRPDIMEESVVIQEAYVNPASPKSKSVTLSNKTDRTVELDRWKIHNNAGDIQTLPDNVWLKPRIDQPFDLPNCPLSDHGDTITLVNEQGLKVDAVSYNCQQGGIKGGPIVFAH
ncbi:uncharacterized protein BJX67DRAFT_366384 [Aspergillus lucknowensis]|uniref:LTD domain-containing protein n=1 Tax=Aspergillus lucknowensis TaxID=176173 RepID=A0ABR4LE42_9EURO